MMKYVNTSVVFREIPNEVTLAVNISNCPNRCVGCHSSYLQQDIGDELDEETLEGLIAPYEGLITCVCLMGGDAQPHEVNRLCAFVKKRYGNELKTAWYSGKTALPDAFERANFDFVKLGPYIAACGPLNVSTTNQRLYMVSPNGGCRDITAHFWTLP